MSIEKTSIIIIIHFKIFSDLENTNFDGKYSKVNCLIHIKYFFVTGLINSAHSVKN